MAVRDVALMAKVAVARKRLGNTAVYQCIYYMCKLKSLQSMSARIFNFSIVSVLLVEDALRIKIGETTNKIY